MNIITTISKSEKYSALLPHPYVHYESHSYSSKCNHDYPAEKITK